MISSLNPFKVWFVNSKTPQTKEFNKVSKEFRRVSKELLKLQAQMEILDARHTGLAHQHMALRKHGPAKQEGDE